MGTRPSTHAVMCLLRIESRNRSRPHRRRYDARVGLQRQGADYVRERFVGQPGHAVVVGLARPHPVTRSGGAGRLATGRYPRRSSYQVAKRVPASLTERLGCHCALVVDVGVQLEWGAEGHPHVGGADVEDVAGVAVAGVAAA